LRPPLLADDEEVYRKPLGCNCSHHTGPYLSVHFFWQHRVQNHHTTDPKHWLLADSLASQRSSNSHEACSCTSQYVVTTCSCPNLGSAKCLPNCHLCLPRV
jgi:hypothetical protein